MDLKKIDQVYDTVMSNLDGLSIAEGTLVLSYVVASLTKQVSAEHKADWRDLITQAMQLATDPSLQGAPTNDTLN